MGRMKLDRAGRRGPRRTEGPQDFGDIENESSGEEFASLRDNIPFGSPASNQFGTYFIGYSRRLWVIERMLENMFVGDPRGRHDRILDYSRPLTGSTFFAQWLFVCK